MGLDLVKFEVLLDTEVGCLVSILSLSGAVMNFLSLDSSFFSSYCMNTSMFYVPAFAYFFKGSINSRFRF